jgi:DNA-binding MarR family transcriptional regulator
MSADNQPAPLIGAMLRQPWELVRDRILAGLHARGFDDLNAAHFNVMQYPGPDGLRPTELAVQMRMTKQAANYLLGQMEEMGYLERRQHATDPRLRVIRLTARGRRALNAMREIVAEVEADWERELGARRFRDLRELLQRLNALVAESRSSG